MAEPEPDDPAMLEPEPEPSGPGPRVIVREPEPEPPASWSTGGASVEQARRTGVTISTALSFPARRAELGELRQPVPRRDRPLSDRELLGGTPPQRLRSESQARVNVWVTVGEDLVMLCPSGGIVVVGRDRIDDR